jgi:hypothetical protein
MYDFSDKIEPTENDLEIQAIKIYLDTLSSID